MGHGKPGRLLNVASIGDMDEPLSRGTAKSWHADQGWGSIEIEGLAAECFAHYSCIVQRESEYLELVPGERVMLTWHEAQQDEFSFVADPIERC
jgi:cold shock CspA family protein